MKRWTLPIAVVLAVAGAFTLGAPPALAAPCPWSLTPTCVTVTQTAPASGAVLAGTARLQSTARENVAARGPITHVEWWLYNPDFTRQNPNNEEGKVLLDERVNQAPVSGTTSNGTWQGTWTVPANRTMSVRDGDYQHEGIRTYTLPLDNRYAVETHVLDAEWDRTYGGPAGRSGPQSVSIDFGSGGTTPPATSNDVQIGTASHLLNGTNTYRNADWLVRYSGTATSPANQWGFEVSVSSSRVVLARSAYQAGMAVPSGGWVLSGHGQAADWLSANAPVGATVSWPGEAAPPPAPANSVRIGSASHVLNGTNVPRGTGFLVRFTGTATSPANQWGVEAAVSSAGVITAVSRYQTGMAIPSGGSVLSGHDEAAQWLDSYAVVGATVS